jgi:hypothetical protein
MRSLAKAGRGWLSALACVGALAGCQDGVGVAALLPVKAELLSSLGAGGPITVTAAPGRIQVTGGGTWACGIERVRGSVTGGGRSLVVEVNVTPLGSCPDRPQGGSYRVTVFLVPRGPYEVEVREHYWTDLPPVVVSQRVEVP